MFQVIDYIIFIATLCISALIGIYFGFTKQKSTVEYLFGKGNIKCIPIAMSLFSSAFTSVAIIGAPTEIYNFGMQILITFFGPLLSSVFICIFILPVFCGKLQITSPYEYFELRFNYQIRIFSTIIYILHATVFLPMVLYCSTISFSEVTGLPLVLCTTVIGGICIVYTMLGGFSAVIWSDTFQGFLMIFSCICILIKGIVNIGSFEEILYRAKKGKRLNLFIMDPNPFRRLTFWSAFFGMSINAFAHSGCGASNIQKFMTLKTEKEARKSTFLYAICFVTVGIILSLIGLTMFAQYYDCDPIKNNQVENVKKLLFSYITHIVQDIPGFLGLFNAGILCAGLSTVSAELNSSSGIIYYDIIKRVYKKHIGEKSGVLIMKLVVLFHGSLLLIITPFMDKATHVFPINLSISSTTFCAKISVLVLGTTFPKTNSIGVIFGCIIGMLITGWISIGSLIHNDITSEILQFSTENCLQNGSISHIINSTSTLTYNNQQEPFILYKLSFMYYSLVGLIASIITAIIVSYVTGPNDVRKMNEYLFIPCVRPKVIYKQVEMSQK